MDLQIIQSLALHKAFHYLSNESGFLFAQISGKPFTPALPWALSIEPTTSCNLRCPECPAGLRNFSRPQGMMDPALFRSIIDQVAQHLLYLNLYFQGEPYLHPGFTEMVRYARSKKIYVATSSNGHFLSGENALRTIQSGLNRLVISMDGNDQSTYEKYRWQGSLDKVIAGIDNLVKTKRATRSISPFIELQFIVMKHNEHQIDEIRKFARKAEVDKLTLKSVQVYNLSADNPLLPTIGKFSRYDRQTEGTLRIKSRLANRCHRMWSSAVITWDGKVLPCCFDKDGNHVMGDLNASSFTEIWNSRNYVRFRKQLFSDRKSIHICCNCTEGIKT